MVLLHFYYLGGPKNGTFCNEIQIKSISLNYFAKYKYLQSEMADLDKITHTSSLGSTKGCILFMGRSDCNSGSHGNIYVFIRKKIFFSETTWHTALIFDMWQWPMFLYINCASHASGVKFGHAPGVDSLTRLTIDKPSNINILEVIWLILIKLLGSRKGCIFVVVLGIIHTCIALRYKPAFTATQ